MLIWGAILFSLLYFALAYYLHIADFKVAAGLIVLSTFLIYFNQGRFGAELDLLILLSLAFYSISFMVSHYLRPVENKFRKYWIIAFFFINSFLMQGDQLRLFLAMAVLALLPLFLEFLGKESQMKDIKRENSEARRKESAAGHFFLIEEGNQVVIMSKRPLPYLVNIFCYAIGIVLSVIVLRFFLNQGALFLSGLAFMDLLKEIALLVILFPIGVFFAGIFFAYPIYTSYGFQKILFQKSNMISSSFLGEKEFLKKEHPVAEIEQFYMEGGIMRVIFKNGMSRQLLRSGLGVGRNDLRKTVELLNSKLK